MATDIKKAKVLHANLPPLSIFPDGTAGYYVRYRVITEDKNRISHWSPVVKVPVADFTYLGKTSVSKTDSSVTAIWGDEYNRPRYDVYVRWGNRINHASVNSGVAIISSSIEHGFVAGDIIQIVETGQSFLDGKSFVVSLVPGDAKKFSIVVDQNVPSTEYTLNPNGEAKKPYFYHGTSPIHTYSFLRLPKFDMVHVDIQVESIQKQYSESLLIYDSDPIYLL